MNMQPGDPLSPEEQALAARLRGIGGAEGPSSALDARILAAARVASSPAATRRRRWRAWIAVPGSALTAVGTAAAFVLVVGAVWQLRPDERRLPSAEASADDGFVSVLMIERRKASATETAAAERAAAETPVENRPAPVRRAPPSATPAATPAPRPEPTNAMRAAPPSESAPAPAAPPAPPPAPAAVTPNEPAPATPSSVADPAVAAESADAAAASTPRSRVPRRATYTSSARAAPDARAPRESLDDPDATRSAEPPGYGPARRDTVLQPADWLQRIRDRHARGDLEGASKSLRLFRESHPHIRLPDDLRELE